MEKRGAQIFGLQSLFPEQKRRKRNEMSTTQTHGRHANTNFLILLLTSRKVSWKKREDILVMKIAKWKMIIFLRFQILFPFKGRCCQLYNLFILYVYFLFVYIISTSFKYILQTNFCSQIVQYFISENIFDADETRWLICN